MTTVLASDSFTNTTGTAIATHNANWVATTAGSGATITTNSVRPAGGYGCYFWNGVTFPADQWSEGTTVALANNVFVGVAVRCSTGNYYVYQVSGNYWGLVKQVGAAWTELASSGGTQVGDVLRLEVSGTTITPKVDGVVDPVMGVVTDASLSTGKPGFFVEGSATTTRLDDWSGGDFLILTDVMLYPDAIAASTNLTGAVTAIDEDPDSPDANWLTATSATAATDLRVTFPTPVLPPDGLQTFKFWVRKTTGTTTPTISAELRQANILRLVLDRNIPVTSTSGQNISVNWRENDLVSTINGSDVELRLYSNVGFTNFDVGAMASWSSTSSLLVSSAFLTYNEVAYPATVTAGDLLVCQAATRNEYMDSGASMLDTGWTAFAGNPYGGSTERVHQSLFWRIADGTEGGGTVIVRTFGNNVSSMALVWIHRFTSTNGFAGTPVANIGINVGMNTTIAVGRTITPSSINQLAVCATAIGENFPVVGSLTGATGGTWVQRSLTGSSLETIGLHTADISSGTAITGGEKIFSATDEYWSAVSFCVIAAPVGTSPVNTVEIGAVQWHCTIVPSASDSYAVASAAFS